MSTQLDVSGVVEARKSREETLATTAGAGRPAWVPATLLAVLVMLPAIQVFDGFNYVLHLGL